MPFSLLKSLRYRLARFRGRRADHRGALPFDLADLNRYPRVVNQAAIRSRCSSTYLGEGHAIARVLGRFKMFVDTRDVGLSSHLLSDGYWEMWLTETMARLLRPGMTVADAGANLGYFTLLMGSLVGEGGIVHAFEPNPAMALRLRQSLTLNDGGPRTTLHEVALGDAEAEVRIYVPRREPKNATLVHGQTEDTHAVRLTRLDALAGLDTLDAIKIDVEGSEEAVWRGMSGILDRNRPLIVFIEVGPERCADYHGLIADMRRRGFTVSLLGLDGRLRPTSDADLHAQPQNQDQMLVLQR